MDNSNKKDAWNNKSSLSDGHQKRVKMPLGIQSSNMLPKLKVRCLSPGIIPEMENVYSKVKISDVFAMEKLILPKFKH